MPTDAEKRERQRVQKLNELERDAKKMENTIFKLQRDLKNLEGRYISGKNENKDRIEAVARLEKKSDKMIQRLTKNLEKVSKSLQKVSKSLQKIESTDWNESKKDLEEALFAQRLLIREQKQNIQMLRRKNVNFENKVQEAFEKQRELNTITATNFKYLTGLVKALKKKKSELEAAEAMTQISRTGEPESDGSSSSRNKKRKGMTTLRF